MGKRFPYIGVTLQKISAWNIISREEVWVYMTSYISYLLCIITVLYFWQQYPKCYDWYFNDVLTPSIQILTQMNDSDQSFPSLKLVSLSVSTELMLRSCSGLSTPLMAWVVKADATCVIEWLLLFFFFYLYSAAVACEASKKIQILDLEGPQYCWWGSIGEGSNKSLKWGEGDVCGKDECECG